MPRSPMEKLWLAGGALLGLLVAVIAYLMFIGPQRSQTSSLDAQRSAARSDNQMLQQRIATLQQQSAQLATYTDKLKRAEQALPSTSGLPEFLRSLQSIGNATLADVTGITVGEPTTTTPASAGSSGSSASSSAGSSASSTAGSSAGSGAAGAAGSSAAAVGPVFSLPITAQVTGTPAQLDQFLLQLQTVQPRAVLVTDISLTAGSASKTGTTSSSLSLTMNAFVQPSSASERAALSAAAR